MNPGPLNAITDVPGILVGHHQRIGDGWGTGTTVVLVPDGAVGAVDGRGGAPGTRETDLLKPENMVRRVNAVCLTGGSAYGLAAADGVMRWLSERNHGFRVGRQPHEVVPILPAAVLFDLPRGDWGNRPTADFGYAACEAATDHAPAQGTVGAGTGTKLGSFKGGLGTASVVLSDGAVVGAIVAANALGEAVDVTTGRPWAAGLELDGEFHAHWPDRPALMPAGAGTGEAAPLNTTIGVVAVNRALSKAECRRLAMAAQDGLARAIRPAHLMFDGDTVFALATGDQPLTVPDDSVLPEGFAAEYAEGKRFEALDKLCAAAADAFSRAITHALLSATALPAEPDLPAYRDAWPGAIQLGE